MLKSHPDALIVHKRPISMRGITEWCTKHSRWPASLWPAHSLCLTGKWADSWDKGLSTVTVSRSGPSRQLTGDRTSVRGPAGNSIVPRSPLCHLPAAGQIPHYGGWPQLYSSSGLVNRQLNVHRENRAEAGWWSYTKPHQQIRLALLKMRTRIFRLSELLRVNVEGKNSAC